VALYSLTYYLELVDRTLAEAGVTEPPVDLVPVASRLGLPVLPVQLPRSFRGALVYEDGMPMALLNVAVAEQARRDTLAHLVAHVLMRIDQPHIPYPRQDPDHGLADAMAEEFCLPQSLVKAEAGRWFNDYRYLARLFAVSEGEMLSRMRELGLVKHSGSMWDY
jgi:Zn-dependent peptidase ImmA (M78 family)